MAKKKEQPSMSRRTAVQHEELVAGTALRARIKGRELSASVVTGLSVQSGALVLATEMKGRPTSIGGLVAPSALAESTSRQHRSALDDKRRAELPHSSAPDFVVRHERCHLRPKLAAVVADFEMQ